MAKRQEYERKLGGGQVRVTGSADNEVDWFAEIEI